VKTYRSRYRELLEWFLETGSSSVEFEFSSPEKAESACGAFKYHTRRHGWPLFFSRRGSKVFVWRRNVEA